MNETNSTTITDLSLFGYRELRMAAELLTAYTSGKADHGLGDGVHVMMNRDSGNVFLTDSDYNVAMMNGETLEQWFNCPYCGVEGFKEDVWHVEEDGDCGEWLESIECYGTPEVGTVSHGTMRAEDLIPAFHSLLETVRPAKARELESSNAGWEDDTDTSDTYLEELFDALDECSPDGYTFGAHPGDGSDYGYWKVD